MNLLDIRTIVFSYVASSAICAAVMAGLWHQNRLRWPSLSFWLADFGLQFVAILLIALRGVLPDFVSVLFGTPLILTGTWLLYIGLERYVEKASSQRYNFFLLIFCISAHAYFAFGQPSLQARNIIFSLGLLALCAQCAWLLLRRVGAALRPETFPLSAVFILFVLVSLARVGADLAVPPSNELFKSGFYDALALLLYQMLYVTLTLGLFLLVNRHLVRTLEDELHERKRMEAALRQSEALLAEAQHLGHIGHLEWSRPGPTLTCSKELYQILGLPSGAVVTRQTLGDRVVPADRARLRDLDRQAFAQRGNIDYEFRICRPDGQERWLRQYGHITYAEDGLPLRMLAVIQDITERQQAEREFRETRDLLHKVFNSSPVAMILTRQCDRVMVEANLAMGRLFGYTEAELLGHSADEIDFWADAHERQRALALLLEQGRLENFEVALRTKAGDTRWAVGYADFIEQAGERYVLTEFVDITARKEAEQKIRESETRLREAQHIAHIGNWEWNLRTGETRWSAENYAIHGLGQDLPPLSAEALVKTVHPDDLERVKAAISQAISAGASVDLDYRIFRPDGSIRAIHALGAVTEFDAERRPVLMVGTNQDITERKKAEQELKRWADIFQNVAYGFVIGAPDSPDLGIMNPAFARMHGYRLDELMGAPIASVFAPECRAELPEQIRRVHEKGYHAWEAKHIRKDGTIFPVVVDAVAVKDEAGKVLYRIVSVQDISERKQAEQALRESEAKLETLFDIIPVGISILDAQRRVVRTNTALEHIVQMPGQALTSGRYRERRYLNADLTPLPLDEFPSARVAAHRTAISDVEVGIVEEDGAIIWTNVSAVPLPFSDWQVAVVTADITARKRAEEALVQRTQALARSNQDLEQFAYVASHDLQEPLRMVASYVTLLAQRYQGHLDARADRYIHYAVEGATRMQALINDLLAYSRVGTRGKPPAQISADRALDLALKNLEVVLRDSGARLTRDPLPTIWADDTQLVQLFQNLVGNALKFHQPGVAPEIHVSAQRQGDAWIFAIRDNGLGIEPQHQERIFTIFQRLHAREDYPGTGIGLAICKKIVQRHGGRVWVESQAGHGSTFFFTWPEKGGQQP